MTRLRKSYRLPETTVDQLDEIQSMSRGLGHTQIIVIAVADLYAKYYTAMRSNGPKKIFPDSDETS